MYDEVKNHFCLLLYFCYCYTEFLWIRVSKDIRQFSSRDDRTKIKKLKT